MAKTRVKKKKLKRKTLILFVMLIGFTAITLSSYNYIVDIYRMSKEKKELKEELKELKEKEKELKLDASKLQNSDYIARYAREKYFYSKEGEYIIKIPEEDE